MCDFHDMAESLRAQEAAAAEPPALPRLEHSAARDRAWGRFYGLRGLRPCIPAACRDSSRPLSNAERIYRWRIRYDRVPVDLQTQPIRR